MPGILETDTALQTAIDSIETALFISSDAKGWADSLSSFLQRIQKDIPGALHSESYLKALWDDTTISSTGSCSVSIVPAVQDVAFREWFAGKVAVKLSAELHEAQNYLVNFHDETKKKLKTLCGRIPHLKVNRIFCAIYPTHFTTIADEGALRFLHREMGGGKTDHIVHIHHTIKAKIDGLLGSVAADEFSPQFCVRLSLPWYLYQKTIGDSDTTQLAPQPHPSEALKPLPATLRRKGLTALKGSFSALLEVLPELQNGLSRVEFEDLIAQRNPELIKSSIGVNINSVSREFDLCRRQGDEYFLSPRGINLLETRDPDELSDHLLTRVFGIDHVLVCLGQGSETKSKLISFLQAAHPGWTSTYAPNALLSWLTSLDVIEPGIDGKLLLTERGKRWLLQVTWQPESTKSESVIEEQKSLGPVHTLLPDKTLLSKNLQDRLNGRMVFDEKLVTQLHAGLWSHPVRHFAVLTGISGSGKTQLALNYGLALCDDLSNEKSRVKVIPVHPGWYDPSHLLGYVNPLQEASYRSTPFLDLLLRAVDDPEQPYIAILDEMNLSHPEQYLAPILSAMETRGWVELHQMDESQVQVPQRIKYPANLAIIGTVNMDETTHGLSDKVLDRAFTLEFWEIDVQAFPGWNDSGLSTELKTKTRELLHTLNQALAPVRMHFGWRTISDVIEYLQFTNTFAGSVESALDDVVYAKVLPKLRGDSSPRFEQALKAAHECLTSMGLSRCCGKVKEMRHDLEESGSTRFWR